MGFFGIGIFWDFLGFFGFFKFPNWDWVFLGLGFFVFLGFFGFFKNSKLVWVFWDWGFRVFVFFFIFFGFFYFNFLNSKLALIFFWVFRRVSRGVDS